MARSDRGSISKQRREKGIEKTAKDLRIMPEYVKCEGIINIPVYRKGKIVGRAILTVHEKYIILTDIYIYDRNNRRRGAADLIMKYITENLELVVTGKSTAAGKELCLKHGFEKYGDILVYRRFVDGMDEKVHTM